MFPNRETHPYVLSQRYTDKITETKEGFSFSDPNVRRQAVTEGRKLGLHGRIWYTLQDREIFGMSHRALEGPICPVFANSSKGK